MSYPKECPLAMAVFDSDKPQLFELTGAELDEFNGIEATPVETHEEGISLDIDDKNFKPLNAAARDLIQKARENAETAAK